MSAAGAEGDAGDGTKRIRLLMRAFCRAAPLMLAVLAVLPTRGRAQDVWDQALRSVVRLDPEAFPALPAAVVSSLEDRACSVPQTYFPAARQNVISGHFGADSATQWAVLCSTADTSEIVVMGEMGEELGAFQRSPDRQWLQGTGGGRIGYSRLLRTIGRDEILDRAVVDGRSPTIERDGIEEIFTEKASTVWYWNEGVWVALPGLD